MEAGVVDIVARLAKEIVAVLVKRVAGQVANLGADLDVIYADH